MLTLCVAPTATILRLQDIAAWMLLHHASAGAGSALDAIINNAASTCLGSLQDRHASAQDHVQSATLFALLCRTETQKETLLRMRANGRAAPQLLLAAVLKRTAEVSVRECAAKSLEQLTSEPALAQVRFTKTTFVTVSSSVQSHVCCVRGAYVSKALCAHSAGCAQVALTMLPSTLPWQQLAGVINSRFEKSSLRGHVAHFAANLLGAVSAPPIMRLIGGFPHFP